MPRERVRGHGLSSAREATRLPALDAQARDGLAAPALAPGTARAVRFSGQAAGRLGTVALAGVDAPRRWLHVTAGRLPHTCAKAACEVVALGERELPATLRLDGLPLRVVGRARLDGVPLGTLPPYAGSIDAGAAFVVTAGVDRLTRLLPKLPRTYAWARVLDPARVHPWSADALLADLAGRRTRLAGSLGTADVSVPSARIAAEQARGRAAGSFALVIAGAAR